MECILTLSGILLAAAALIFRKKLSGAWIASLITGGLIVTVCGAAFTFHAWKEIREDERNVHIALRYLSAGQYDEAAHYLKKIKNDTFESVAAEALTEKMRGNDTLAKIRLDALESKTKTDNENSIYLSLNAVSSDDYYSKDAAITMLHTALDLSKKQTTEADTQYVMESGNYVEGISIDYTALSEQEQQRLQLNQAFRDGAYQESAQYAAALLDDKASAKNRLLFAEIIADAAYSGEYFLYRSVFEDEDLTERIQKERKDLSERIEKLQMAEDGLRVKIDTTTDETAKEKLRNELSEMTQKLEKLRLEQDYLYVYRALNSIANLHSLEAAVIRARLYFALDEYEKAVSCITGAASNPLTKSTASADIKNALNILKEAEKKDTIGKQSEEFKEAMTTLLSSTGSDFIGTRSNPLTKAFVEYLITEQKTYGSDLYISGIDTSNYPEIVVTVSGRDVVIDELLSSKKSIVRDTNREVSYKIKKLNAEDVKMDICCVVDESGSMGGSPTEDLKQALYGFINALDTKKTRIGIVGFEGSYEIICPMDSNHVLAAESVSNIRADGGTNITAGIEGAIELLRSGTNRKTILLMTDGQSSIDMNVVRSAADMGCVIHCIGFGGVNDDLLQSIADATGGQYIRAATSAELINVYLNLVGMIGNEIEIRYTVPEQTVDEITRYFFVSTVKSGTSLQYTYTVATSPAPELHYVDRPLLDKTDLLNAQQYGEDLRIGLHGINLAYVTEIVIGGNAVVLNEDNTYNFGYSDALGGSYIEVSVPPTFKEGWQDIILKDANGNEHTFDNMCCVGDLLNVSTELMFGDLRMEGGNAMLLSDQTLVIDRPYLRDDQLFSAYANGVLAVSVNRAQIDQALQDGYYLQYTVPEGATVYGYGALQLNSNDYAYDYYTSVPYMIAYGSYQIVYHGDELRVIMP